MKETYFYSEEQNQFTKELLMSSYTPSFAPNGKEYTECFDLPGEHKSTFDDAIIVCERIITPLTLEIIESYNFPKRTYKPDWDDTCNVYTLPNGLELETMTQCNNEPCDSNELEGLDSYIHIDTKEELDELLDQTFEEICIGIAKNNQAFLLSDYI